MSRKFYFQFLICCLCLSLSASIFAQTSPVAAPVDTNITTQNALLQIQEQLHAAQLAIADTRVQDQADAATNVAMLTARIQSLEQTVADQHAGEAEANRKSQQFTLTLAAVFAFIGLAAFLLVFYFQWRAFSQFAEITARQLTLQSGGPALAGMAGELAAGISAPARATVETSNVRLLTLVERLEKKVVEMEQTARAQLAASAPVVVEQNGHQTNGDHPMELEQNGHAEHGSLNRHEDPPTRVTSLLADGQTLLNAEQPENALKLFEQALALDGNSTDALIKKAGALERLHRVDESLACYNRAIELDNSATMAWLQKGGLYNRLARYDEAMQCYEKALQAQGTPG